MEGLVLPVTAFMSFASILWLVVAKLADSGVKDEAETTSTLAESNNDYDENVAVTVHSSSGNIQISAKNITTSATTIEKKRMSRRQRKNVKKREKESENLSTTTTNNSSNCSGGTGNGNAQEGTKNQKKRSSQKNPSKFYVSLGLNDDQIYYHLLNYILDQDTLRSIGFPLESQLSPGKAWVYQDPEFRGGTNFAYYDDAESNRAQSSSQLDVNAREFVPKNLLIDDEAAASGDDVASTHSSNSLSASAKEFVPTSQTLPVDEGGQTEEDEQVFEGRNCARCNKLFYVFRDTGECVNREECLYHWGKARSSRKYSCCGRRSKSGCEIASSHVWRGILYEISGQHKDLDGFAKTRVPRNRAQPSDGNYGVYGIDGEMLFTTHGLQLCKVTVVGIDGRLVYETIIRPDDTIIDYNTRFSGVTARDLKRGNNSVKSLKDVQNDLLGFINANTILIGHGLENDLRALKLVHMTVIDTSLVFPHYYGMPFRRSLKSIVQSYLKREIQASVSCGHDSYEDARSGVELMLWKVQQDFCQQSSSTSPRPPTTTAGTRLEPMTSSPISGPASSPISGLTSSSPMSGSGTSGLGISGSTTSGLACGSNSSVSSQYSSSAYSACSPPTSTSF